MHDRSEYTAVNAATWDRWASERCIWTLPIDHADYLKAKTGELRVFLTPTRPVPPEWLTDLEGKDILGLASGGGQQCPAFVAHNATVTVLDISEQQLAAEMYVARREEYDIDLVQGDMTSEFPFADDSFDMVFHPVSNSYVDDVRHLWKECYRVLRQGGLLLAGFANPAVYMFSEDSHHLHLTHSLPFNPLTDLADDELRVLAATDGIQFSHSLSDQIGGQLEAGFCLLDMYEDYHQQLDASAYTASIGRVAASLSSYMPIYISTIARKPSTV